MKLDGDHLGPGVSHLAFSFVDDHRLAAGLHDKPFLTQGPNQDPETDQTQEQTEPKPDTRKAPDN
jgi:hypothetical protein